MEESILIISPSSGFGELIRQALEEAGDFAIALEATVEEARQRLRRRTFDLCILDADVGELSLPDTWNHIRQVQPNLRLLLLSPDLSLSEAVLERLSPAGVLNKPFYMPDLLSTVFQLLSVRERSVDEADGKPVADVTPPPAATVLGGTPGWLEDVDRAAQHLTRLSLESAAQASLILRGDRLWAYAGELSQPAVDELVHAVADYWATDGGSDLVRFIRLGASGGEYMLYATGLDQEFILSLAFDARTPFSEIRSQASHLARSLGNIHQDRMIPAAPPDPVRGPEDSHRIPGPREPQTPDPGHADSPGAELWLDQAFAGQETTPADPPDDPSVPHTRVGRLAPRAGEGPEDRGMGASGENAESGNPAQDPAVPADVQPGGPPSLLLHPVSPAVHHLEYSCLLIPRLPQHQLHGDLATRLEEWIPRIGLSYGWRLIRLIVQVDRLGWIASLSPEHSPAWMVRCVREETSRRIFASFPALRDENPSEDFWAPGYLIVSSAEWPSTQVVNAFVNRTRTWQGFNNPR